MELINKEENGWGVSPVLPEGVKNFLIDIDGTVCDDIPNEQPERMATATLYPDALEIVNKWHGEGHIITFFTSRTEEHREVTEKWLAEKGFRYHGILMGKPRGGNYAIIDNHLFKTGHFQGNWQVIREEMDGYVHEYNKN